MALGKRHDSGVVGVIGVLAAAVAIIGSQVFGWEWGDGRLLPILVGVLAAGIALIVVAGRVRA